MHALCLKLCKQLTQQPFLVNILDPNGPMQHLNLNSIALPFVSPDQVEITNKASPRGAALTKLGRILDDCVVNGDAAVVPLLLLHSDVSVATELK